MKHRFIDEYANYVRKRFESESLPEEVKTVRIRQIEKIPRDVRNGFITVADAMKWLAEQDSKLIDYVSGEEEL